jgi:site-specific recombinase XerD
MLMKHYDLTAIPMDLFELYGTKWLNETRAQAAPKTTGRRLTSLKVFAKWAKLPNELGEYRAPKPSKSRAKPLPERLDGLMKMEEACSTYEQRAMIGGCSYVGLRIGEALACHTSWFDLNLMLLTVRGKGDKERVVPISERAWESMQVAYIRAMAGDGYLVHYEDRAARKAITSIGRKAGISVHVSSHKLRATYATIMSENGVPIRVIQELLGHASMNTTEVYTEVTSKALHMAVQF